MVDDRRSLPSLTGLRAAAAGVVLLSHLRQLVPVETVFSVGGVDFEAHQLGLRQGNAGVSLFFLLSGFVLMWAYRPNDSAGRFWARRFARIYPAHVFVWAVWIVLMAWGVLARVGTGPAVTSLLLVHSWVPQLAYYYDAINPPTWSLATEMFFYACFPVVAAGLARFGERAWRRTAWTAGAVAVVVPLVCFTLFRVQVLGESPADYWSYVFPPARMAEFVLGATLAMLVRAGHLRSVPVGRVALLAFVAYMAAGRLPRVLANSLPTLVPFVLVILSAAGADLAGRPSFWRHPLLVHLGRVSFAVFLVQWGVIEAIRRYLDGPATTYWGALAVCAAATVVILVLAEALHHGVERPAERRVRRRCGGVGVRLSAGRP